MATEVKEREVALLAAELENARSVVLSEYTGMDVFTMSNLRRKCRENGVRLRVTKNTLLRRALNNKGQTGLDEYLKGQIAVAFSQDEVAAAKLLAEFAKANKELSLPRMTAGIVGGNVMTGAQLDALAKLPSKLELITQLLYVLQSPARNLVTVLNAPMRDLVMVLQQVGKSKESQA